jgi:putative membrane protein
MNAFIKLILTAVAVLVVAYLLPGVHVDGFFTAFVIAIVLAILNVLIKPVFILLTIPLTFLTLGFFLLVINAIIILMADALISGFEVNGFWWAMLFSLLLSLTNALLGELAGKNNNQ